MGAKCILLYTSMSGNTEKMAGFIAEGAKLAGLNVEIKEMYNTDAAILADYNGILLGSCTWGDGELPDEALDFYEEMGQLDLHGKTAAAFGSCDSNYDQFGGAVDLLSEKLQELGADLSLHELKVERTPDADGIAECRNFGRRFGEILLEKISQEAGN